MPEDIETAIADALVKMGYKNVEHNCGTIWYEDADGGTWAISAIECESGERA